MYKFLGACTPEIWEDQSSKIRPDLEQLLTLTTNVLGIHRDIKNRKQN